MKFSDLPKDQQITHIKGKFTGIISDIVSNPAKLDTYFPSPKAPVKIEPKLTAILLEMSDSEKARAESQNAILRKSAEDENAKNDRLYKQEVANHQKVKDALGNIKARPGCICEPTKCLDIDACVNCVGPEFDPIITAARKLAEEANY